jgi:hypothetical protein
MSRGKEAAAGCIVALVMLPVSIILQGFVLCQLWTWFVTPLGVKEIGTAHALGLSTVVSMFNMKGSSTSKKDDSTPFILWVIVMAVGPALFCLVAGWLFHSFM